MTRGTKRFLLSKTLEMLLTLLVVTVLSFLLVRLSPVDPAEAYARRSFAAFSYDEADMAALRARMGLDQPLIIQYGTWVMDALHLDFGESFVSGQPVFEKVTTAIGITVRIVLLSGVLQAVGILALGPLLYVARGRFSGRLLHFLCIAGVSIPSFFFASSYLDLFAVKFRLTSVVGSTGLVRYLPPAICIAIGCIALFSPMLAGRLRFTRGRVGFPSASFCFAMHCQMGWRQFYQVFVRCWGCVWRARRLSSGCSRCRGWAISSSTACSIEIRR